MAWLFLISYARRLGRGRTMCSMMSALVAMRSSSCLRPHGSSNVDRSKNSVHVTLANVTIRISGRLAHCPSDEDVVAADLSVWQAEDLCAAILRWAHYCRNPHSRKAQTVERALSVA